MTRFNHRETHEPVAFHNQQKNRRAERLRKSERCSICHQLLNQPGHPETEDCGGDCVRCMAEAGDPECVAEMRRLR